jgi:general L-amino acid transport system substrate-binding protein
MPALAQPAPAESTPGPTLAAVKKRGHLLCGANGRVPGFSFVSEGGQWSGLEVDFCRALAAAVLGDAARVRFVPVTTANRFDVLRRGEIDVLTRNSIDTLERSTGTGVRDAAILYYDRQVVVVAQRLGATRLADLHQGTICTLRHTPYATALGDWFAARNLIVRTVLHDGQDALYKALLEGRCNAVSQVMTPLAGTIVASGRQGEYFVLPDLVTMQPLAAFVRAGEDSWFDIVRWTFNALLHGEDLGITSASAAAQRTSAIPAVRRLLGVEAGYGRLLGLDETWAYEALRQVGNYAEIYERNVGARSPLRFARGINALWDDGGVMVPIPLR